MKNDLEPEVHGGKTRISAALNPATILALNVLREDSGGPHWPARDASIIPSRWTEFTPTIEAALASLDDGQMRTFCAGEASEMKRLRQKSSALELAGLFLDDFFESWSLFSMSTGKLHHADALLSAREQNDECR